MTKALHRSPRKEERHSISSRLRDGHGAISDHLRSMYRLGHNDVERSLVRDLIVLHKSRSLRGPSTSPPSWFSPATVDGFDGGRKVGRANSLLAGNVATSEVAALEACNNCSVGERDREVKKCKGEESSRKSHDQKPYKDSPKDLQGRDVRESGRNAVDHLRTLSEKVNEVPYPIGNGDKEPFYLFQHGRSKEHQESIPVHCGGLNRRKKHRLKSAKQNRGSVDLCGVHAQNILSAASNSVAQGIMYRKDCIDQRQEEDAQQVVAESPRNIYGIPWYQSRIHDGGKTFIDKAGRSLSCGLSDLTLRKTEAHVPQKEGNALDMLFASDHFTSTSSVSEVQPLLSEASRSQDTVPNQYLSQDYSGELSIFSNHSLSHEMDSDLASEARSGDHRKHRGHHYIRHISLTKKYMPKTFKDIVGQNLVVQALSNGISRKKVGLIYLFYGPHGTGKTSCARVFAKALNCHSIEHPRPCDVCNSCISYNLGRSRDVLEFGPVGDFDFETMIDYVEDMMLSQRLSRYRVFVIDCCDALPPNLWVAISKAIDLASEHVVFVLVSLNIDHLPYSIISRCQKFFFPKLKDSDIISTLQHISAAEGLEIDKDALKLIASRSDGSLRDAEMTLDQLNLLGKKVSPSLVQELVGLVSDEKLVDLLDLAFSADTVNTVKNLREIMETGVDPLALMSQLATVITDILAGSYVFAREKQQRKFFQQLTLSKKDMEKLRQALKILSEAEKQLRVSKDKLTWLTAALLQLAPDQQYMLPSSSVDRSPNHNSIIPCNNSAGGNLRNSTNEQDEIHSGDRGLSSVNEVGHYNNRSDDDLTCGIMAASSHHSSKGHSEECNCRKNPNDCEKIWRAVLDNIQSNTLRQFLFHEGRLSSVSLGAAPTVQLFFRSNENKSKAERLRARIIQAFESVLASAVVLEIRCASGNNVKSDVQIASILPTCGNGSSVMTTRQQSVRNRRSHLPGSEILKRRLAKETIVGEIGFRKARWLCSGLHVMAEGEIIERGVLPEAYQHFKRTKNTTGFEENGLDSVWVEEASSSQCHPNLIPFPERKVSEEQHQRKSLVRGKVSLAHVIQQAEGCSQQGVWSRRKATSIAEKLERDNLRLEPRSRRLLCWKASRITSTKLSKLRIRTRRPSSLLKIVRCGRGLSGKPRRKAPD